MLKFTPLPFIKALHRLAVENEHLSLLGRAPEVTMEEMRRAELVHTINTNGFQLVLETIRQIQLNALSALRSGVGNHDRLLGRLECIEEIQRTLSAMLSVNDRQQLDLIASEISEDWFLDAGADDEG